MFRQLGPVLTIILILNHNVTPRSIIVSTILNNFKEIEGVNPNWDLELMSKIKEVDSKVSHFLLNKLYGFIPHQFSLHDPVKIPNIHLNLTKVSVDVTDIMIHNILHPKIIHAIHKNKLGKYNGTFGYLWPHPFITGSYRFLTNLNYKGLRSASSNFTIEFFNYSETYEYELSIMPLKLKTSEVKLHVQKVKVDVGRVSKNPLISQAIDNIASNDIEVAINNGSKIITEPLGYGVSMVVNGGFTIVKDAALMVLNLLPGGPVATSATVIGTRIYRIFRLIEHYIL